jgi:hypothetical protein
MKGTTGVPGHISPVIFRASWPLALSAFTSRSVARMPWLTSSQAFILSFMTGLTR